MVVALAAAAALLVAPAVRAAPPPRPGARALVVGSNRGGPGQEELRFAEDDARRFADVLVELSGYDADKVEVLRAPGRDELLAALAAARQKLREAAARGDPSVFTFFYSGHARASALSLGTDELPLAELRRELLSLPSTVTLAILDACQTGAISQIKGAAAVADFSVNSVADLNAAGTAIMASSTGSELSQESDELRASYFTHHLLVGLRGAADADHDGRVTLAEAYRYAYNRTLVATAGTAVGRQHVTLENDLRGKGEMVLTWPADATAHLSLPGPLAAELVLQKEPGGSVVAEVSKVAGAPMSLGLLPGKYAAIVTGPSSARRCEVSLAEGATAEIELARCAEIPLSAATAKSAAERAPWAVEVGAALLRTRADAYTDRLSAFGFEGTAARTTLSLDASIVRALSPRVALALRLETLGSGSATRGVNALDATSRSQTFDWSGAGLCAFVRFGWPLFDDLLTPYFQAGAGHAHGFTHNHDTTGTPHDHHTLPG
jgi:hypothetical protein